MCGLGDSKSEVIQQNFLAFLFFKKLSDTIWPILFLFQLTHQGFVVGDP